MRTLQVYFLPSLVESAAIAGGAAVVIDVLRATTTIAFALAAGARAVIPCLEVGEARRVAADLPAGTALLGGERGGVPIPGFDFGNSPEECIPLVRDKTVVFTTTNGTKAMNHCQLADDVLLGAFVNRGSLCELLKPREKVHLVCSGTNGEITREDVLLAGAVVARLQESAEWRLNDQAIIAAESWRSITPTLAGIASALLQTQGGRNLVGLGLSKDLTPAADLDRFDLTPRLNLAQWKITAAS